jgi:hypothetical protein
LHAARQDEEVIQATNRPWAASHGPGRPIYKEPNASVENVRLSYKTQLGHTACYRLAAQALSHLSVGPLACVMHAYTCHSRPAPASILLSA